MSAEDKLKYTQFVQTTKDSITEYQANISKLKSQLSDHESQNRYICLAIVTYQLRIANVYLQQNDLYTSLFNSANKDVIESARKTFGEIMLLLKKHFELSLSREFSKNPEYLEELDRLTPQRILNLLTQFEYLCTHLRNAYGGTSKFLVPIASLYGDTCGFAINIIDIPKYFMIMKNLHHPEYNTVKKLLDLVEKMFNESSKMFIDVYSISNEDKDQIYKALKLLYTLESYYRLTGKQEFLPEMHRKKQSWERFLSN